MSYLLFIFYLILICWLLGKIKFITRTGLGNRLIISLFLVRLIGGMINGYINLYHYPDTDAASFHLEGIKQYHLLFNEPLTYLTDLFKRTQVNAGLLDITDSFWNNLRSNILIKLLSLFNILSGGNFFINTLLFNFLVFFGPIAFYRIMKEIFPNRKYPIIISIFLLPSVLYFSTGIHKDGIIFLALGISCYNLFFILHDKFTYQRLFGLISGLFIIFLMRNFILITLLPAITAWIIAARNKKFVLQTFIIVHVIFILAFFLAGKLHPALDLPQYVSIRQNAFVEIAKGGQSAININPLYPHFRSFLNNSPQAINHSLMRPYLTETSNWLYIPAAIETFAYEVLIFIFLLFGANRDKADPYIYFGLFFSISMLLMIGYTIPIIGAIVRYKSIYLPFLITPLLCCTNWERVRKFFRIK